MPCTDKLRLDKYLWATRFFKTRTLAAAACDTGKVKCKGLPVKASKQVHVEDEYEIKTEARRWRIKVCGLLMKRVKHQEAIKYYMDITPAEETGRLQKETASFYSSKRKGKKGRPTKKHRRDLDDFLEIQ